MRSVLSKAKNWEDFKATVERLSPKQRGDCFEALTKYYLQLDPKYQTKLKTVWLLKDVPAKVRKRLNLPDADEGIDLVAQTKDGEFWAIQCKYRSDESKSLSRPALSTFADLAFGVCKNISLALVCTTAERLSHKLRLPDGLHWTRRLPVDPMRQEME